MAAAKRMLGEILAEMGAATPQQIEQALLRQKSGGKKKLGEVLVEEGVCSAEAITRALAEQHGLDIIDLDGLDIPPDVISMVDASLARQHRIVPVRFADGVLTLAMPDPVDLFTLDELRFVLNCNVQPVIALWEVVERALAKYYGPE